MRILVYGDSNVWGDNFITKKRIPEDKQWVNILQKRLGDSYTFYQEGLPGRVAGNFLKEKKYKNGKNAFLATLKTVSPVDIIIIALGTNDLQIFYNRTKNQIIKDLIWYRNVILEEINDHETKSKYYNNKMPRIIYILPPNFDYIIRAPEIFDESRELVRKEICKYFTSGDFECVKYDKFELFDDGIHLNYNDHEKMADLVMGVINNGN